MVCQPLRLALLIGAIAAATASPAWASHHGSASCCNPCPTPCCSAPAFRTVMCTECVPETYTVKRTCYRYECRTECVNGTRTECVPVCKTRVCNVTCRVPCVTTQCRKVCTTQTCWEDRVVMKTCYRTVQETVMKKQLVCRGHWETQQVPVHRFFRSRHNNCCDPCAPCCVETRCKKVWVNCPEYRCCPVTVCRKVCVQVPTCCKVPVCKTVWRDVQVQCCTWKCVTKQVTQNYTCWETRCVPCKTYRTVRVCVPYETCVTCVRYVQRQVCRQVPCDNGCNTSCCYTPCCNTGCSRPKHCGGLFGGRSGGLFGGHSRGSSGCCYSSCGGCGGGCN